MAGRKGAPVDLAGVAGINENRIRKVARGCQHDVPRFDVTD